MIETLDRLRPSGVPALHSGYAPQGIDSTVSSSFVVKKKMGV
jgi:hypothetical protein